jgi:nicotinamidase-related amidase
MSDPNLTSSALAVIDMQRYFLDEEADAYLGANAHLLTNVVRLIEAFRTHGKPVAFTRHAHPRGSNTGQMGRWWHEKLPWEGDRQSELVDELAPRPGELLLTKTTYSAFEGTSFEAWLRKRNVRSLVLCGVMTNLCVETTARHAFMKDFQPIVVEDACASNRADFHKASILNLGYGFALIETTTAIATSLGGK